MLADSVDGTDLVDLMDVVTPGSSRDSTVGDPARHSQHRATSEPLSCQSSVR